jgi:hypothetical protein
MKGPHGGADRGQGRHKVLKKLRMRLDVAAEFERLWKEAKDAEAFQKHMDIRKNADTEQEIDDLQQAYRATTFPFCAFWISQRLDEIGRRLSLPLKRPKDKDQTEQITAKVIEWCKQKYGIEISARRVDECRKEYHRLLRHRDNEWPT